MSNQPNEYGFDASLEFPSRNLSQYYYKDEFNTKAEDPEKPDKSEKTEKIIALILAAFATLSLPVAIAAPDENEKEDTNTAEYRESAEKSTQAFWNEKNNF